MGVDKLTSAKLCAKHGITLVNVPFWWDLDAASLVPALRECMAHRTATCA